MAHRKGTVMRLAALAAAVLAIVLVSLSSDIGNARAVVPYGVGDVFAGVGGGKIKHFDSAGNLLETLDTGTTCNEQLGMAFDSSSNLYATSSFGTCFPGGQVVKFNNTGSLIGPFGSGYSNSTESIAIDSANNVYVGQPDGTRDILKFDAAGAPQGAFDVATEDRGSDWIDLAADQCTMYYTSEGSLVKRFDVCTNTQLPDFASGLSGPCFALRIRANGEVMVTCQTQTYRLNPDGSVNSTYPVGSEYLFAMNLDPDGTHFWTAGYFTGNVYKVDIASGAGTAAPVFNASPTSFLSGLTIFGEPVVSRPTAPPIVKDPHLANLWLCQPVATCALDSGSGVGERDFNVDLNGAVTSISPKGEPQTVGSFEFEVRYDRKLVNVDVTAGSLFRVGGVLRSDVGCATTRGQGFVQFRCNVKGKDGAAITGPGTLAVVHVTPTADVYSMVIPSQENGIATQLINQGCELSDLQGHPIASSVCGDADVTLRYLEGDVNADCIVDVRDQQEVAFRWNSHTGQLLYNSRFDLEPAAPKLGDGDIDAHDMQVIYGRHGSTCGAPHPAQDPVDPKATTVPAPTPVGTGQ